MKRIQVWRVVLPFLVVWLIVVVALEERDAAPDPHLEPEQYSDRLMLETGSGLTLSGTSQQELADWGEPGLLSAEPYQIAYADVVRILGLG